jgi:hypothetical protein
MWPQAGFAPQAGLARLQADLGRSAGPMIDRKDDPRVGRAGVQHTRRGMSGPTVKKKIADRYRRSKKQNLILLVVADLDPAGDSVAQDIREAFERGYFCSDRAGKRALASCGRPCSASPNGDEAAFVQ